MTASRDVTSGGWESAGMLLRGCGLRSTPQRRLVIDVLAHSSGHVSGADVVARCRRRDAAIVPSTVYRTLDALEAAGVLRHAHAADGRVQYHMAPVEEHGHAACLGCGREWELPEGELRPIVRHVERRTGLDVDASHVMVAGRCSDCRRHSDRK